MYTSNIHQPQNPQQNSTRNNSINQLGQFSNYQKMRQSISLLQDQHLQCSTNNQWQKQLQRLEKVLEQSRQKVDAISMFQQYEDIQTVDTLDNIQRVKQLVMYEVEDYFDDLLYMAQKQHPCQSLKDSLLNKIDNKLQYIQKLKEQPHDPQQQNYLVNLVQDLHNKADEMEQHPLSTHPVEFMLHADTLLKIKSLLPELASLVYPTGQQQDRLDILTNDYFMQQSKEENEKVMVVINDHLSTITLYNVAQECQSTLDLRQPQNHKEIPYQHSLVTTPDYSTIFLLGGVIMSSGAITNKVYQLDMDPMTLVERRQMAIKRIGHAVCYLDGYIYVVGGKTNDKVCTRLCERYHVATDTWQTIAQLHYGRSRCAVTKFQQQDGQVSIYAFFGSDSLQIVNNTIEQYIVSDNIWKHINIQFPFKRLETSGLGCCQINNEEIIIFGGFYEEKTSKEEKNKVIFSSRIGSYNTTTECIRLTPLELPVDYNNSNSCQAIIYKNTVYAVGHFMQQKSPGLVRCLDSDYVLKINTQGAQVVALLDQQPEEYRKSKYLLE